MAENDTTGGDKMGGVQGEGNYEAGRKFDREQKSFVDRGGYEEKAREAEQALDGPEGEDLERARRETAEPGRGMDQAERKAEGGAHGGTADG